MNNREGLALQVSPLLQLMVRNLYLAFIQSLVSTLLSKFLPKSFINIINFVNWAPWHEQNLTWMFPIGLVVRMSRFHREDRGFKPRMGNFVSGPLLFRAS